MDTDILFATADRLWQYGSGQTVLESYERAASRDRVMSFENCHTIVIDQLHSVKKRPDKRSQPPSPSDAEKLLEIVSVALEERQRVSKDPPRILTCARYMQPSSESVLPPLAHNVVTISRLRHTHDGSFYPDTVQHRFVITEFEEIPRLSALYRVVEDILQEWAPKRDKQNQKFLIFNNDQLRASSTAEHLNGNFTQRVALATHG